MAIAHALNINPDDDVNICCEKHNDIFEVLFKSYVFIVGFEKMPTEEEIIEEIKELYLGAVEFEFELELGRVK